MHSGVVAGGDEELAGDLDADAVELDEFGRRSLEERGDLSVEDPDLVTEIHRRARSGALSSRRRSAFGRGHGQSEMRSSVSGRSRRQRLTSPFRQLDESSRSADGAPIITPQRVLNACVRALTAVPFTHAQGAGHFNDIRTWPSGGLLRFVRARPERSVRRRAGPTCRPCVEPTGSASSMTSTPARQNRVNVAPNDPVHLHPDRCDVPEEPRIQPSSST